MLLQALVERQRSERINSVNTVLPAGYKLQRVGYRLDIARDGSLISMQEAHDELVQTRGVELSLPYATRTSGTLPLPIDRGDYVFGIPVEVKVTPSASDLERERKQAKLAQRTLEKHQQYIELINLAEMETGLEALVSISEFLRNNVKKVELPEGFDPSRFVAIYVDSDFFPNDKRFQDWWASYVHQEKSGSPHSSLRSCVVCGELSEPVEIIAMPVAGLSNIGGKAIMGLVTGNSDTSERHGMPRASGASLCQKCGNDSHQALNALIDDPARSRKLGNAKLIWWATEECEDLLNAIIQGDSEGTAGALIDSIRTGRASVSPQARFYSATLGANVSRVVVRGWVDTSLDQVVGNILDWMARITIIDRNGSTNKHPGIFSLLSAVTPPGSGDVTSRFSPPMVDSIINSALYGAPLPRQLLSQCLLRIRAETGEITTPRAALLKAFIFANQTQEISMTQLTRLNSDDTDVAYRCGRLLAVLDNAARLATGANNELVDRSYSAASTTPAATFPRLLKLHRAHINKLRRDNPGAAYRIQQTAEDIMWGITSMPSLFTPIEQARFALGMYHQQASDRQAAVAGSARKQTIEPADTSGQLTDHHK